jgi:hypothetical protein
LSSDRSKSDRLVSLRVLLVLNLSRFTPHCPRDRFEAAQGRSGSDTMEPAASW